MNKETVAVDFNGTSFVFNAEPNVVQQQKIKTFAAEYLGGFEKYAQLEAVLEVAYLDHLRYCKDKFGETNFHNKQQRLTELGKEDKNSKEFDDLFNDIYGNTYYLKFLNLSREQNLILDYAWLKVMCIQPEDYIFDKQMEPTLRQLLKEVKEKLKFFRDQEKESKEVSKS